MVGEGGGGGGGEGGAKFSTFDHSEILHRYENVSSWSTVKF